MGHLLVRTGLAVLLGTLAPGVGGSWGQADPEQPAATHDQLLEQVRLQRERIGALERRIGELTSQRRDIVGTLRQMEATLANLRESLGASEPSRPPISGSALPADPLAAPAALMRELRAVYQAEMAGLGLETPAQRAEFAAKARLWARLTNRDLRGKRSWLVRLDDLAGVGQRGHVVRLTVLDESTGLPIGEAVDVGFPAKFLERFNRGSRSGRWVLTSIVIAKPTFNEHRTTPGVFEFPPYVGPMMEFDFELDWFSLSAWEPGQPVGQPTAESIEVAEPASPDQPAGGV